MLDGEVAAFNNILLVKTLFGLGEAYNGPIYNGRSRTDRNWWSCPPDNLPTYLISET